MKKRVLATMYAGIMIAGVMTGCGGQGTTSEAADTAGSAATGEAADAAEPSGEAGKTTLNVLWWGSQTRHEQTTAMLEKFEELNPDIDVVMDYSDWDGYWTKLPAQVAGGQTPDVFQMD